MLFCTNMEDIVIQNEYGQAHRGRLYKRHALRISNALNNFDYKGIKKGEREGGFVKRILWGRLLPCYEYPSPHPRGWGRGRAAL